MTKVYTTEQDFTEQELVPALDGVRDDFDPAELFDKLVSEEIIIWDDAFDADLKVHHLDRQGWHWADEDDNSSFWTTVEELDAQYGTVCDAETGVEIATATKGELIASLKSGTDEGFFIRDGRRVYVHAESPRAKVLAENTSRRGPGETTIWEDVIGITVGDIVVEEIAVATSEDLYPYLSAIEAAGYRGITTIEGN